MDASREAFYGTPYPETKATDPVVGGQGLPSTAKHPFYQELNLLLEEASFDPYVEGTSRPYYAAVGHPGPSPGVYSRMLFVGYFEGIDSPPGIAWRCSDSRSLHAFLGYLPTEETPDHSHLADVRRCLPEEVHEKVFAFVLRVRTKRGGCTTRQSVWVCNPPKLTPQ